MEDSGMQFELDDDGKVILLPVIGWRAGPIKDIGVILAVRYIDSDQPETEVKVVQFALTPQKALDLSETLTKMANRVLKEQGSDSSVN